MQTTVAAEQGQKSSSKRKKTALDKCNKTVKMTYGVDIPKEGAENFLKTLFCSIYISGKRSRKNILLLGRIYLALNEQFAIIPIQLFAMAKEMHQKMSMTH